MFNYSLRSWLPNTQHYQRAVVKALSQVSSVFGITKIVQSVRGTNFTSSMFTEILKLLQVKHAQSNPYHPQSQGATERFHQTLKSCCVLIVRKWIVTGRRDCLPITVGRRNQNNEGLAHASGTRSYSGWDWVQPKLIGLGPLAVLQDDWKTLRQVSDRNHLVATPTHRRKSLFHAYLLKPYHACACGAEDVTPMRAWQFHFTGTSEPLSNLDALLGLLATTDNSVTIFHGSCPSF